MLLSWVYGSSPPYWGAPPMPLHTTLFLLVAVVMPFSWYTLLELSMTHTQLSGGKSLRDSLVQPLLSKWVP